MTKLIVAFLNIVNAPKKETGTLNRVVGQALNEEKLGGVVEN